MLLSLINSATSQIIRQLVSGGSLFQLIYQMFHSSINVHVTWRRKPLLLTWNASSFSWCLRRFSIPGFMVDATDTSSDTKVSGLHDQVILETTSCVTFQLWILNCEYFTKSRHFQHGAWMLYISYRLYPCL